MKDPRFMHKDSLLLDKLLAIGCCLDTFSDSKAAESISARYGRDGLFGIYDRETLEEVLDEWDRLFNHE